MGRARTLLFVVTLVGAGAVAAAGCGCKTDITIAGVDPGAVYNGVDFPTSIYGTAFMDAQGKSHVKSVSIHGPGGDKDLMGVNVVDANRIDAVVPMGLAAGTYDVVVHDIDGCQATASGALTVVADVTVSICAIDPAFGYTSENTDVTITATMDGTAGGATCGGKSGTFVSSPRAWLVVGGALQPLGNVAFVSAGSLTGTVAQGIAPGSYDLLVQNPDGGVGLLPMGFKVVDQPVPSITSIDPPTIRTNFAGTLKIIGTNFRGSVKVELLPQTGAAIEVPSPTVVSATEVDVHVDATALALGVAPYIVRVTDLDQGTFGDYSVLGVLIASGNLATWTDNTMLTLPMPTMRHGAAGGQVSTAARYIYAVGGDGGGATPTIYDTTQVGQLDKYGNLGSWVVGRNKLPEPRTMLQVVAVPNANGAGGYLYAVGGDNGSGAVAKVSRAKILLPGEAPVITRTQVSIGGALAKGTWYYRVAAVLDGTDPANPSGETLPSEEVAAHTVDKGEVTLEWQPVDHAASYRVYRTAMVDGVSKTEVLLADGVTGMSDAGLPSFVDDGSVQPTGDKPLSQGELGVWVDVTTLTQARRGHGATLARDPNGKMFLYAVGGDKGTGFGLPAAADVLASYEYASVSDDGLTLGSWTADATNVMSVARTHLQAVTGEHTSSPSVPATQSYVYAVGGHSGTALDQSYQPATVTAGGALTWGATQAQTARIFRALSALITSDTLYILGGINDTGVQAIAKSGIYATVPLFGTLNDDPGADRDTSGTQSIASFTGLVYSTAHFFLLGGTTDGTKALARVWSQVY